ncbi:hypothetical protein BOX15_Mlig021726g2 [Macrostomum lignano]|uniref:PDZ domain-containing protein n=1 Tax=Macrostomum lignano TaxID=282301 RepID=A0A267FQZ2_9PLAT|nr:hypothetical protein BOX15_Mlig021726g2 [Macrostomum lignano]
MDFVILKVNGLDLSGASHNEAVEAFRQAKEPIIVQVVRQSALNQQTTTATMHRQATVGGPTMIPPPPTKPLPRVPQPADGEAAPCCRLPTSQRSQPPAAQARCPTTSLQHVAPPQLTPPPVPPFPAQLMRCGLFTQASSSSEAKTPDAEDDEFYNNVDDEFDYEEVVLCRSSAAEKLGLTLCYSSMDGGSSESPTEVFVSEVEPSGIAAASSRIRPGDQILRINGHPVRTRDQAVRLFGAGDRRVALLVARPSTATTSDTGGSERSSSSSAAAAAPANLDELHLELMMLETPAEIDEVDERFGGIDENEQDDDAKKEALKNRVRDQQQDSGVSSTQSSEQEVEELAAALTRITRSSSASPSDARKQQQQQQQQPRCVPRMGTRLQRGSPQPKQQQQQQPAPTAAASRSAACQTVGTAEAVEGRPDAHRRCQNQQHPQRREQRLSKCAVRAAANVQSSTMRGTSFTSMARHQPVQHWEEPQQQQQQQQAAQPPMEWVVKRRADGSRYVTRRPVLSRLLKARAAQVAQERAGLTTDDDAASCLGRWAPRHERKRHLLRTGRRAAQQQQQQQQQQLEPASVIFV